MGNVRSDIAVARLYIDDVRSDIAVARLYIGDVRSDIAPSEDTLSHRGDIFSGTESLPSLHERGTSVAEWRAGTA